MEVGIFKFQKSFTLWNTEISHVTPRKSIAFEWLILEVLYKAKGTEFENESLYNLFTNYFQIKNANILITPAIRRLYDLQAINLDFSDDFNLREYAPKDITLQPLGIEMHKKGLLPGKTETIKMQFLYDEANKKLSYEKHKFVEEPLNIKDSPRFGLEFNDFPEKVIRNSLEEKIEEKKESSSEKKSKKKGNKSKLDLSWVQMNTEIGSITPICRKGLHEEHERKVILTPDFKWHVEGCKDNQIEEKSLTDFNNVFEDGVSLSEVNLKLAQISNADKDIEQIILNKDVAGRIKNYMYQNQISIVDGTFFNEVSKKKNGKKDYQIIVVSGSDENSVECIEESRVLLIKIEEKILPDNCFYKTDKYEILYEGFKITAGNEKRIVPFAYLPRNRKYNFQQFGSKLIEDNYYNFPELLFMMPVENIENRFIELVRNDDNKAEMISNLNKTAKKLLGKNVISESVISQLLLDRNEIASKIHSIKNAMEMISQCSYSGQVFKDYVEIILKEVPEIFFISDIHKLLDTIKSKSGDSIGYFDKKNLLLPLYSLDAKVEIIDTVFGGGKDINVYIDFEKRVVNLYKTYSEIQMVAKTGQYKKLKDLNNKWNINLANLNKICHVDMMDWYAAGIKTLVDNINRGGNI